MEQILVTVGDVSVSNVDLLMLARRTIVITDAKPDLSKESCIKLRL